MKIISNIRSAYRKHVHSPRLDGLIYKILDLITDTIAGYHKFSFPKSYIRHWKLNMLFGKYEPETFRLFQKIVKPGMVVVDIGAHIGYFTRLFAKLTGTDGVIYALEADPENFSLLQKNTAHLKNVRALKIAAIDKKGEISFYRSEKTGCHSTIPNAEQQKEVITVTATDLDSLLLTEIGASKIDLIKMDIEGGEMAALRGMTKIITLNPKIALVIEFNPGCLKMAKIIPTDFIQTLRDFGFQIFSIQTKNLIEIEPQENSPEKYLLPGATFVNLYCVKQ